MASGCRRNLSVTLETLLHDPKLLIQAPTPATPSVHHLQALNLKTILMTSHKDILANTHKLQQAVPAGGIQGRSRPGYRTGKQSRGKPSDGAIRDSDISGIQAKGASSKVCENGSRVTIHDTSTGKFTQEQIDFIIDQLADEYIFVGRPAIKGDVDGIFLPDDVLLKQLS